MRLSINIDHVATLRNARGGTEPSPLEAAKIVEHAGADGIVCHLREDRRHMRDGDLRLLRSVISTKLDLEMAATPEIVAIALRLKPDLVTLVPEKRRELTTEGGLDVVRLQSSLDKTIRKFHSARIPVSLFIDPVKLQIDAAVRVGADMIELHTGEYANARTDSARKHLLRTIKTMAAYGQLVGLGVNAGHGLNYSNTAPLARIGQIEEVSIGHAVIVRALFVGLDRAVKEMVRLVKKRYQ